MNKQYATYSSLGLCVRCGSPRDTAHIRCSKCHNEHLQYQTVAKAKATSDGLCRNCLKEPKLSNHVYCSKCRTHHMAKNKSRYASLRSEVISAYGGECSCCKTSVEKYLELDHINNDGAQHRKEIGRGSAYRWARQNNFPPVLQLLCGNCHNAKRYGGCSPDDHA